MPSSILKSIPPHLLEHEAAVGDIGRPFRCEADAQTGGDERDQRIGVVAAIGDVLGQIVFLELPIEIPFGVGEVLPVEGDDLLIA